jgi:hypothetical protein
MKFVERALREREREGERGRERERELGECVEERATSINHW